MLRIKHKLQIQYCSLPHVLLGAVMLLNINSLVAEPKVFSARFNEDSVIERLYEAKDVSLTITRSHAGDKFLEKATVHGVASIDAVSGRVIVELEELVHLSKNFIPLF